MLKTAMFRAWIVVLMTCAGSYAAYAQSQSEIQPGMEEKLGQFVDLEARFNDEAGSQVILADLVDKPTILNFVYFNCPGICSPALSGLQKVVDQVDMVAGIDYDILTISINHDEGPALAAEKKANYMAFFERPFPAESWHWLTADSTNIKKVTESAGFHFRRFGNDFAHPASLIMLSSEGKITRYLPGTKQNPFDLKLAVLEAGEGKVMPTIAKILEFCFSYDPEGREYVVNIKRIMASLLIIFSAAFFATQTLRSRKKKAVT